MIAQSFSSRYVPKAFKLAAVIRLLKKANLIPEILKNFRPISNVPFLSKVIEKVAAKQLCCHKEVNRLRDKMQSVYYEHHSTETGLLKIHHDLLMSMDRKNCLDVNVRPISCFWYGAPQDPTYSPFASLWHNWKCSYLDHIISYRHETICHYSGAKVRSTLEPLWCAPGPHFRPKPVWRLHCSSFRWYFLKRME